MIFKMGRWRSSMESLFKVVVLDNVFIHGFKQGIVLDSSSAF